MTSRKGFFSTLWFRQFRFLLAKRPEPTLGEALVRVPVIIAGQVDVLPGQWREVREQAFVDGAVLLQCLHSAVEMGGVVTAFCGTIANTSAIGVRSDRAGARKWIA